MTISSSVNKVIFNGDGVTTVWPFTFPVLEASHLSVIKTSAAGVETTLSTSLYTITGAAPWTAGSSVTYPLSGTLLAVGEKLTILRTVPYTQSDKFSNQGGYYPEIVEARFDKVYMALQQMEERLDRTSQYLVSDATTEQSNLTLIQQLQLMDLLIGNGDLLTRIAGVYARLPIGSDGKFLGVSGTALAWASAISNMIPAGRLTLETGVPVSSSDQLGKSNIYYTPAGVGYAQFPVYDGSSWSARTFTQLSNDTTASVTGKAGAAAAGPYQIQDCFVWNDAETNRLTRGPKWTASSVATMTIAAPGVVTWTAHGLWDGATVRFTTTGALPTGLAVNTDYFVTKVDANSFKLSTTLVNQVAGTFITTSGTQSGVHTAYNYTRVRGTGAGTCELQLLNGVYVNKYDITNGPAATKGTYVGSVYFNASSQMDLTFGSVDADFGEAIIGIWNAYNQVPVGGTVQSSLNSWSYSTATWRPANASAKARATKLHGLVGERFNATGKIILNHSTPGAAGNTGVALNATSTYSGVPYFYQSPGYTNEAISFVKSFAPLGLSYITLVEKTDSPSMTYFGDNNDNTRFNSGLFWEGRY